MAHLGGSGEQMPVREGRGGSHVSHSVSLPRQKCDGNALRYLALNQFGQQRRSKPRADTFARSNCARGIATSLSSASGLAARRSPIGGTNKVQRRTSIIHANRDRRRGDAPPRALDRGVRFTYLWMVTLWAGRRRGRPLGGACSDHQINFDAEIQTCSYIFRIGGSSSSTM
jgi:hypothetical protein